MTLNSYKIDASSLEVTKYLVCLHGLFGNANNWRYISYAEPVRQKRNSILVDLRNHGDSDHNDIITYPEMADDVIRHMKKLGIDKFTLLGHSMGAKVAMNIATMAPQLLDGLIIVDSAPKDHRDNVTIYQATLDIINKVSEYEIKGKSRKEVMEDFKHMFVIYIHDNNSLDLLLIY